MSGFEGRGIMVAQSDSFPPVVLAPRMKRIGLGRVEIQVWDGAKVLNAIIPRSYVQEFAAAGIELAAWSQHLPGADHAATFAGFPWTPAALNMAIENGFYVEIGSHDQDARNKAYLEMDGLLTAAQNAFPGTPLAVTISPGKDYAYAALAAAGVDVFVELYDGATQPLWNTDALWAMTRTMTSDAKIPESRVRRCVCKGQLPLDGDLLIFIADAMDDQDYR